MTLVDLAGRYKPVELRHRTRVIDIIYLSSLVHSIGFPRTMFMYIYIIININIFSREDKIISLFTLVGY